MKPTQKILIGAGAATLIATSAFLFNSCKTIPKNVTAVSPFDASRYLGHWYEIARLDFHYESHLNNTTATYSLNEDNTIKVVNRGYNYVKEKWDEATGKAKFVNEPTVGMLKVSFFGPFYSGYNVVAIDKDYKYALIIGKSTKYMWLLSREKTMPKEVQEEYLDKAKAIGVKTEDLVWVEHR